MYYFITMIGILFLYIIWHIGIKPVLLDNYRHKLFELRDQLFDFAQAGNLNFDSLEYRTLRIQLNNRIRYAHRITLIDLFMYKISTGHMQEITKEIKDKTNDIINSVKEDNVRNFLADIHYNADMHSAYYFIQREPLLYVFVFVLFIVILIKDIADFSTHKTVEIIEKKFDPFWDVPLIDGQQAKISSKLAT